MVPSPEQQAKVSLAGQDRVAVGIKATSATQRHVGIWHKTDAADPKFTHLAWHFNLRTESERPDYLLFKPDIPDPRARQVAAMCRKIWRSNGAAIPYAFSPPNDCFDLETGRVLLGPKMMGLTCSSFVLAVFAAVGVPLVNLTEWPERPDDKNWQAEIVELLRANGADQDHIDGVKREIGCARFRPEEVAGAARVTPLPASYLQATASAVEVLRQLGVQTATSPATGSPSPPDASVESGWATSENAPSAGTEQLPS